jgi:type IV fimbrial biogenesis protein FimT
MVELVVSMAIAAVLIGVGLPAFNGFIVQQRLTADANSFAGAIAYARSESTRRGDTVSLQAIGNDNANEWGAGFCIVVGTPGNCTAPLRVYDPVTLATVDAQGDLDGVSTLSFNGRGLFTLGVNGQLDLCSNDTLEDPGRQLDISVIGRLNIANLDCPD